VCGRSFPPSGRLDVRACRRVLIFTATNEFSRDYAERFSGGFRRRFIHIGRTSAVGRRR